MKNKESYYNVYITETNDTWDLIAYKVYGDEYLMNHIKEANKDFLKIVLFPAGVHLTIPKVEKILKEELPPWL
ncbi:MAG: tail protein X [Fusobacteriaceae bacterium]